MIHALQITRFGDPSALKWVDEATPLSRPDGVKIQVTAAGVNFADIMMRMGLYPEAPKPPFIPGYEVAGKVIEIGPLVKNFKLGDRVLAGTRFGGYASEVVIGEHQVRKIPARLSDIEAAAIPVNFLTASVALEDMARVRKGDRVLIQSAAGGVGVAAVQIAAQAGAHVVGLVGSKAKGEVIKSLGAAEFIINDEWELENHELEKFSNFQIILDSTGGESLKRSFDRLAPGGRVVNFGASSVVGGKKRSLARIFSLIYHTTFFTPYKLMTENKGVFGLNMLQLFDDPTSPQFQLMSQAFDRLMERFEKGAYKVIVGKTFPMPQGAEAHSYLQGRTNIGKVVLTVPTQI